MPMNQHLEFGPKPKRLATLTHLQTLQHQPKDLHLLWHQPHRWYQQLDVLHLHLPHRRKSTTMKNPQYTHFPELKMQRMPC